MKTRVRQEFLGRAASIATTEGLERLETLIETNSPLLIWGAFEDHNGGGCIYTWLGRFHPVASLSPEPGPEFLRLCGMPVISYLVAELDSDPEKFLPQLLKAIRLELFYRRGVPSGRTGRSARKHPSRPRYLHR
jgi:hypothetical protein